MAVAKTTGPRITGYTNSNSLKAKSLILFKILDEIDGHNDWQYKVASAFMIAHDYGFKRVMSSYYFQNTDQVSQLAVTSLVIILHS
jgi:hypothetical protein